MMAHRTASLTGMGALAAALLLAPWMQPRTAQACGGFFCNNSSPVNQQAERIIFSKNEDGSVTAVIQILYQGPAEQFAWVLPVEGSPEVEVSSDMAFNRLQQATNPTYRTNTTIEGTCMDDGRRLGGPAPSAGAEADGGGSGSAADDDVSVVDEGSVGPYDYVVINVDESLADKADVAEAWLSDNGYDIPEETPELLRDYLEGGMNLLAFRLTKGNDAGSIRPVKLTFGQGQPFIPIRPTAVAATEDMGVMVWVLGEHRAVPSNYKSLELNDALLNWFNPNSNYNDVIIRAAGEAKGQGFVTEMAWPTDSLPSPGGGAPAPEVGVADMIVRDFERTQWEDVTSSDWTDREGELLNQVLNMFRGWDGLSDAVRAHVPIPDGVTEEELLNCVACHYRVDTADIEGFEPEPFLMQVATDVVEPMENTRALFEDRPYMTRLYTTMSPADMTKDPAFDFNPDLEDHSNQHTAEQIIECSPSVTRAEAPWRMTLPSGETVRGSGRDWPFDSDDEEMPATRTISRVGTSGGGEVVEDNTAAISAQLQTHNSTVPTSAGGCSVAPGNTTAGALGLVGLFGAALALRRRRRH